MMNTEQDLQLHKSDLWNNIYACPFSKTSVFGEGRSATSVPGGGSWTFIIRLADLPQITTTHFRKQYERVQSVRGALPFASVVSGKVPCTRIYAEGADSIRYYHWNNTRGRDAKRSRK
jgi:hypothetical protein